MKDDSSLSQLEKINRFTRKALTEDEVYCFSVILCDNETDRDNERFSINALNSLAKMFIGKTGIFDHNPKGENQTARIFDTEVITDTSRKTSADEPYTCLKASAYMVRTSKNEDLIKEIDAGIKKEVSVSCCVSKHICSICHCDNKIKACTHKKGRIYNGQKCSIILDDATDAYEWSFVAVPAQINAGVTKHFTGYPDEAETVTLNKSDYITLKAKADNSCEAFETVTEELRRDIIRMSFILNPQTSVKTLCRLAEGMTLQELVSFRSNLSNEMALYKPAQTLKDLKPDNNNQFKL